MKIVVLAGGTSTERDVSLLSGSQVCRALRENGHQAILLDVYLGYEASADEISSIFESGVQPAKELDSVSQDVPDLEQVKAMRSGGGDEFFGPNVLNICKQADIVFIALHGQNGENGRVQAAFDLLGIHYTGNGYVSCAMSMAYSKSSSS